VDPITRLIYLQRGGFSKGGEFLPSGPTSAKPSAPVTGSARSAPALDIAAGQAKGLPAAGPGTTLSARSMAIGSRPPVNKFMGAAKPEPARQDLPQEMLKPLGQQQIAELNKLRQFITNPAFKNNYPQMHAKYVARYNYLHEDMRWNQAAQKYAPEGEAKPRPSGLNVYKGGIR